MDYRDGPGTLYDELVARLDPDTMQAMVRALAAGERSEAMESMLRIGMPFNVVLATGLFASGTPQATTVGQSLVGLAAAATGVHVLSVAGRVHTLGRLERRYAADGQWEVALFACGARLRLMDLLSASRTRTALAAMRGLGYAAATEDGELLQLASAAFDQALAACPPRGLTRVRDAAAELAREFSAIPNPGARGSARTMLWAAFAEHPFEGRPEVAIEAASDYGELATSVWGRMIAGDAGESSTYVTLTDPGVEITDPVDAILAQSRTLLVHGLASLVEDTNRDTADAWVRKLVTADALPMPLILESYADAMDATADERVGAFRDLLAEDDVAKSGALRMIGIGRETGRDGPER